MATNPGKSASTSSPPIWAKVWKILTSVPGVLAAAAALLVTIGSIISQSKNIKSVIHPPKSVAELVHAKVDYPRVFPFRLRRLIGRFPYLKWFHIKVNNESKEQLALEVYFEVRRGPATELKGPPAEYTVPPREPDFERDLDPNIEFTAHEVQPGDTLEINCRIFDEQHKLVIYKETTNNPPIDLLPDNVIDWALTALGGNPVPQQFILASLTTWTVTDDLLVKQRADELRQGIRPHVDMSSVDQWFARGYARVFRGSSGVQVDPAAVVFPAPGRQTVRTPSQVLEDGEADPLEAALLLGALSRMTFRNKLRWLVLFAVPMAQDQSAQKNILLSWSIDSLAWRAVGLAQANTLSFGDNERLATPQVVKLLSDRPEILSALSETGVFLDKPRAVLALDFSRADRNFHMTAWQ